MVQAVVDAGGKREEIYEAAVAEFLEKGFRDASMDMISARAEASKRTVYKHFQSKENLFREMLKRQNARFINMLDIAYQPGRDIREQLVEMGRAEGKLLTSIEVMSITRMLMTEVLRSPELVAENREKTDFHAAFEEMFRAATEHGQLQVDNPRRAAEEFLNLMKGRAFWAVIYGAPIVTEAEMEDIIDSSVTMIMSRYGT